MSNPNRSIKIPLRFFAKSAHSLLHPKKATYIPLKKDNTLLVSLLV